MEFITRLLESYGELYSEHLGIDPEREPFKWLLASVLFGAPIRESTAVKTYEQFVKHCITTPDEILKTGWHTLVDILDQGGYTRYDYKTADKLLEMAENVKGKGIPYSEEEVTGLAKGIGNVTANIFLRELRGFQNIDPEPQKFVYEAAENLGLLTEKNLQELKRLWAEHGIKGYTFLHFEAALLKLGKNFCRKGKHKECGLQKWCISVS